MTGTFANRGSALYRARSAYANFIASILLCNSSVLSLPLFPLYGALTHQAFAHAYIGSHRHAFTVGFISMMILGVSSRVVPIRACVDSKRMNSLWAPFILFNLGCT